MKRVPHPINDAMSDFSAQTDLTPESAIAKFAQEFSGMNGISLEMTTPHTLQISKKRHWALALLRLGLLGLVLRQKKPHAWVRARVSRSGGTWITVTPLLMPTRRC